jgi:hypothetical protein
MNLFARMMVHQRGIVSTPLTEVATKKKELDRNLLELAKVLAE